MQTTRLQVPSDLGLGVIIGVRDDDLGTLAADTRARGKALDRRHLHKLDECLTELEDARERDVIIVTPDLAIRLGGFVPGLRSGMPIIDALDLVFTQQEAYLPVAGAGRGTSAVAVSALVGVRAPSGEHLTVAANQPVPTLLTLASATAWAEPLDETRARDLTERIRSTTRQVCILLFEAHQRRAWLLLRYRSWEQYIHSEFGFSRSRSYELVDQGRVIQAVRAAAGMSAIPDISAYAALQIKSHLTSLTRTVAERTAATPQSGMSGVVSQVVRELRERLARERLPATFSPAIVPGGTGRNALVVGRAPAAGVLTARGSAQLENLFSAIDWLAHMPPVVETIATIPVHELGRMSDLEGARLWLAEFAGAWKAGDTRPG